VSIDEKGRPTFAAQDHRQSNRHIIKKTYDGSYDIYLVQRPAGKESNWVQTVPNKGWFMFLRLYGPLEPCFEKTWRPVTFSQLIEGYASD
jgi:hypothetical protein